MKRIRVHEFGGPEVLKLEDAPDLQPGAGEVLIRVKAAGINPYETYARSGAYGANNPPLPYTPGSDAAGVVEAVGEGVTGLRAGDRVYTAGTLSGGYAELALCKPEQLHRLPERVSFSQGCAIYVAYATAYRALFQLGHAQAAETVLIHGASGGTGIAAVQLARAAGLVVIGSAGSEKGLELLRSQGVKQAVNHRAENHQQEILNLTGGRGVDLILEMAAHINLGLDLPMLAPFTGRVVVIGARGKVEINPRDMMYKQTSIIAMLLWNTPEHDYQSIFAGIEAGLEAGTLQPVVGLELPLAAASEGHRRIMEPGAYGKIVLIP